MNTSYQSPVILLKSNTRREFGKKAQFANIYAGKAISDIVKSTFGPKPYLKMLLDPIGGIVMTNDGNAILREIDVDHPAAKSVIELSRSQDEEVGDGTTSVVILAGEILSASEELLKKPLHPTVIVSGFMKALNDSLKIMESMSIKIPIDDDKAILEAINSCLTTKLLEQKRNLFSKLALEAVKKVCVVHPSGRKEIDIKKYAKVEKIPGGEFEESSVFSGVILNKDVTHPSMPRCIKNPRVALLDCTLEYKKGESQTNVEITKEEDWCKLLEQEETEIRKMCDDIISTGCNVVVCEKGVSDLAQHFLLKKGIAVLRRVRKTDNNRLSRVTGAQIVNRTDELTVADIGLKCGLFEIKKIGDEYYAFFVDCENPKACTILLRGGSKDVLNEYERNFNDAINVARNIMLEAKLLPGGGATEMEVSARLHDNSKKIDGRISLPYKTIANTLEIIPITIAENCGSKVVKVLAELRSKHSTPFANANFGFDGNTGEIVDVTKRNIWDSYAVKCQVFKTAIEAASMLLRIDDVVSGISSKNPTRPQSSGASPNLDGTSFNAGNDNNA